jgi:hypothetical protein
MALPLRMAPAAERALSLLMLRLPMAAMCGTHLACLWTTPSRCSDGPLFRHPKLSGHYVTSHRCHARFETDQLSEVAGVGLAPLQARQSYAQRLTCPARLLWLLIFCTRQRVGFVPAGLDNGAEGGLRQERAAFMHCRGGAQRPGSLRDGCQRSHRQLLAGAQPGILTLRLGREATGHNWSFHMELCTPNPMPVAGFLHGSLSLWLPGCTKPP